MLCGPIIPSTMPVASEIYLGPSPAPSGVTCAPQLAEDAQNDTAGPLPHTYKTLSEQASSGSEPPPGLIDRKLNAVHAPCRSIRGCLRATRVGSARPPKASCFLHL
ncbi:hypothetical protein E2C01_045206 [Portunus trituberculatus]|uniref:Uncharacterized protein n=1 Tax=Portunus trituberculatus TaxID=210409 RepID=A0A5B7FV45_PORTR|nr:hypothetical protein [Portunus trituberculatus]